MGARQGLTYLFGSEESLIPIGIGYGDVIFAAGLRGQGSDLLAQMEGALRFMCGAFGEGGAGPENVARVTAYVTAPEDREPVYEPWDRLFPDAADRPAFKVLVAPLAPGVRVQLDALGLRGGRRRRIDIPGVPARDPTVVIGDWVLTSRVHGTDPKTGEVVPDAEGEARQAFENVAKLLELAGGRHASQLTAFVRDPALGNLARKLAGECFPERPRLTVLQNFIRPVLNMMVELLGGEPHIEEIPGDSAIPVAMCIDHLLFVPGVSPPSLECDFEAQLRGALRALHDCLVAGGSSLAEVAQVSVYMRDLAHRPVLNQVWAEQFADPADRPPHKYVPVSFEDGRQLVRLQAFAIRGGRRQVLEIPGMEHGDPMSMGVRVGNLAFSSRIVGTDTETGITPAGAEPQADLALRNVAALLRHAGGTPADLTHVNAFINDDAGRQAVLDAWRRMFPDGHRQPALRFLDAGLPGASVVRLEIMAHLGS